MTCCYVIRPRVFCSPPLKLSCVKARCLALIVSWCQIAAFRANFIKDHFPAWKSSSPTLRPLLVGLVCVRVFVWIVARCITSMAAVSTTAKIPSSLNLSDRLHQGENWKSFRREWKFYELAAGIHKKAQEEIM